MKNWINFPLTEGVHSKQAHTDLPEGTYERELGREGFFGPATQIHHKHPPTNWTKWEGPLAPHAYDLNKLTQDSNSPWAAQLVLHNANTKIRTWNIDSNMEHLVRNADGDEAIFIHHGSGDLYCDYGHMTFRDGDYLVLPRGTMWRIEVNEPVMALMIEATGSAYQLPEKTILGRQAIFDNAILATPKINAEFEAQQDENEWEIVIKHNNELTTVTYPFNPLDAIGWHGDLTAVRLNWRDIRPLMSHRYHLPPSAHCTFLAPTVIICTFCPRPIESDPGALKVPFFHNNDDYDEVIFYHKGQFFSRDNIDAGMMTFHPAGFTHGPHPKAFEIGAKSARKETDEVAVMIDTRNPLIPVDLPEGVENMDYVNSWKPKGA